LFISKLLHQNRASNLQEGLKELVKADHQLTNADVSTIIHVVHLVQLAFLEFSVATKKQGSLCTVAHSIQLQ